MFNAKDALEKAAAKRADDVRRLAALEAEARDLKRQLSNCPSRLIALRRHLYQRLADRAVALGAPAWVSRQNIGLPGPHGRAVTLGLDGEFGFVAVPVGLVQIRYVSSGVVLAVQGENALDVSGRNEIAMMSAALFGMGRGPRPMVPVFCSSDGRVFDTVEDLESSALYDDEDGEWYRYRLPQEVSGPMREWIEAQFDRLTPIPGLLEPEIAKAQFLCLEDT